MPVLDATVGGASANSYATLAEAQAYHDSRLYSEDWYEATPAVQTRALLMATRLLDAQIEWIGDTVASTQALRWPRGGAVGRTGYDIATSALPQELKDATAELARLLIAEDPGAVTDIEAQGITSVKAGPVEVTFDAAQAVAAKTVPDSVFYLVRHLGEFIQRGLGSVRLVRV